MNKSLQGKILFWSGFSLLVTIFLLVTISSLSLRKNSITSARENAVSTAENYANQIKSEIDIAMDAARTLSSSLSGLKDDELQLIIDREGVNSICSNILKSNKSFLGVYTGWEANAFDGRDADYIDISGSDGAGRFLPYWVNDGKGGTVVEALLGVDSEDYYNFPKNSKTECIIDPYLYPVNGVDMLLTSVVVPILSNGKFLGIGGVDIALDFLQNIADGVNIYDNEGVLALISHEGLLSGVTSQPDLVGKNASEYFTDVPVSTIKNGEQLIRVLDGDLQIFVPIKIGRTTTPWATSIIIPMNAITKEATALMWKQIVIGLLCLAGAGAILYAVSRGIVKPIYMSIEGLNEGADQVTSASSQLSKSSQQLAEGSSDQASSLEEVSASLEEMTSMTKQNADNSKMADTMSNDMNKAAENGADAMVRMEDAIQKIKSSSDETAKIIKTIDEIAFQTNLLALNAAVEAARAGEAGAGFAVVADEVRNLAMRAADAAKTTSSLIEESQENADNGVSVTNEVSSILSDIGSSSIKVKQLIGEVSSASDEQSDGIGQINKAILQMDKVTQSTAANAEESASASEELMSQAQELKSIIKMLTGIIGGDQLHIHPQSANRPVQSVKRTISPLAKRSTVASSVVNPSDRIMLGDSDFDEF